MDLVDLLLKGHKTLRGSLKTMTGMLGKPSGVGWEDRMALDHAKFSRHLNEFLVAFEMHEAVEDDFLARVVRQMGMEQELNDAVDEGHRSLREITRLFKVIVAECDGEHAYRVRMVLVRLSEELERHLAYEEERLFPTLRKRLPAGLLRALARRAIAKQRAGLKTGGRERRVAA
jgi:hemerythrin-like domain-containing protein